MIRACVLSVALVALSLTVSAPAAAQFGGAEELARTTALTAADDYRIGKGYFDMLKWLQGSLEDPEILGPVDALVRRLVASSDRPNTNFNVMVVPTPDINAAALPGGFLMINKGIIDSMPEDQLAFVIGHEIAHVQLRHFATTMNMTQAMEVLGVAEGGVEGGDRPIVEENAAVLEKMARSYARNLELEGDLYGMLYAMRAGYPASSGVEAMRTMKRLVGDTPPGMEEMADHPSFTDRIEQLAKGLTTIEETYGLFEAGVSFARQGQYDAAIPAFQQFLALFPKSAAAWSNLGACYLQKAKLSVPDDRWHDDIPVYLRADVTVRAIDTMSLERARDAFNKAVAINPNRDAALANLAVLARLEGDLEGAKGLLAKAMELDGKYAGYHNNQGILAAVQGQWKDADKAFAKALKLDGNALYVKVNQAVGLEKRGKKKDAIALWRELEAAPQFAAAAGKALTGLGETPVVAVAEEAVAETSLIALLGSLEGEGSIFGGSYEEPAGDSSLDAEPVARPTLPRPKAGPDGKLGEIAIGMSMDAVKAVLGAPDIEELMEDGFYGYMQWFDVGMSAMFTDDAASGFEVFDPCATLTARKIGRGAGRDAVLKAYGEPEYSYVDPDWGLETLMYESRGVAFYLSADKKVESLSIWAVNY